MNDRQPNWEVVVNELLKTRTQADLAEMVGVAQQQISNLKNGNRGKNISYTLGYDLLSLYKMAKIKS